MADSGEGDRVSWSRAGRLTAAIVGVLALVFLGVWVIFLADNAATKDWYTFILTVLNGVTLAALYFIVASGFTLIFGLMRVVNMAHGTFFLLGGYIALTLQRRWVGKGDVGLQSSDVNRFLIEWVLPLLIGGVIVGFIGLGMQQSLLRWNQGQELRQALITIAFSIIVADLMLSHWGGVAKDIAIPQKLDRFVNLRIEQVQYSVFRLFILFFAVGVGLLLWLWLKKTRTGMVIRAGVDDRAMVQALGINIQVTFAIAFFVGSFLAGLGGGFGGSFGTLAPGLDGQFLLNSLVVVIIGGMGSLGGAAIGALLYGMVGNFAATYLPSDYNPYSIIFTFVLLAVVLAVRPLGLFGRPA
jgi:branched-chain amino acid transport system permease protein